MKDKNNYIMGRFKNREHFCCYCNRIVMNKCEEGNYRDQIANFNDIYTKVWNNGDFRLMYEFLNTLKNLKVPNRIKDFNIQLKQVKNKYNQKINSKLRK